MMCPAHASRIDRLGLALMVGALVAWGAYAGDDSVRLDPYSPAYKQMRNEAFARAGLPLKSQCHWGQPSTNCNIVDHIKQLCLHCLECKNTLDNIQIQPCLEWTGHDCVAGPAFDKDLREKAACARVRAGRSTPEAEAEGFKREWR